MRHHAVSKRHDAVFGLTVGASNGARPSLRRRTVDVPGPGQPPRAWHVACSDAIACPCLVTTSSESNSVQAEWAWCTTAWIAMAHMSPSRSCDPPERDIPPILERIVMRALSKLPLDRFASSRVFANALEIAARGCLDDRPGPRPANVSCDASTLDIERRRSHRHKPGTADAGRRRRG